MEDYKDLPIGIDITDFKILRENGFLYIDKTEYMWKLIKRNGTKFMARPRRFGKTMFLSALKYLFQGKKELFDGLTIAEKDYEWKKISGHIPEFRLLQYKLLQQQHRRETQSVFG